MADWITCSSCLLKHSARPDGRCPRCGAATSPDAVTTVMPPSDNPYAAPRQPVEELPVNEEIGAGIRELARAQRRMIMGLALGWLGLLLFVMSVGILAALLKTTGLVFVIVPLIYVPFIINGYHSYKVAKVLGTPAPWAWAIGGFVPGLIGLIVIAILSSRANAMLKAAGIPVGFFGVSAAQIAQL